MIEESNQLKSYKKESSNAMEESHLYLIFSLLLN